jgi:PII-like signaling protein
MILGFSSGCLYKTHGRLSKATFDVFRDAGANAIEIMWHENDENADISKLKKEDLFGFEYISLHAPSFDIMSETQIVEVLEKIKEAHQELNFDAIIIHPYATANWEIFKRYDLPFLIENMDWGKDVGKFVESLQEIFSNFDTQMVLDVNHCLTNDPSMHLIGDMYAAFEKRIKEIHLSGFESFHEPLFKTKQDELISAVSNRNVPIIIESVFEDTEELKKEFEFVKSFLVKEN